MGTTRRRTFSTTAITAVVGALLVPLGSASTPAAATALPVNGAIAFTSNAAGQNNIYVMDADGANPTQLTTDVGSDEATWSPDGEKIAFISARDGHSELYVMNADGSSQTRMTTSSSFRTVHSPVWSPDGTKIVFQGGSTLYAINADGTDEHRLNTTYLGSMERPTWSPDGSQLAFSGLSPDPVREFGLFLMNADGSGEVTRLTLGRDDHPTWSPDGTTIAFNRAPLGLAPDIFTVSPDGTGLTNLTGTDTNESEPTWSPDGTKLAFHMDPRINNIDIYVVDADGSDPTRLTTNAAGEIRPAWQPVADTAGPDVQCGSADGAWHGADVTISCTATDSGSGLADPADASFGLSTSVPGDTEDSDAATESRSVCDNAGNCTTAGPVTGNKVDKQNPVIALLHPDAQTYLLNEVVLADYTCTDGGSDVATCTGPVANGSAVDTASAGAKTFGVTAFDAVGNTASSTVSYTVGYDVAVLYDPTRVTKRIKVSLVDAAGLNVSSSAVVLTVVSIDDGAVAGTFSYNARTSDYTYALRTRGLSPGQHTLAFTAGSDPTVHSVLFRVR